jgi:hypothetical protein
MRKGERLVLCGGAQPPKGAGGRALRLDLHGPSANVELRISDLARRLLVNIPDPLPDLLEIATYVYAADGVISRGRQNRQRDGSALAADASIQDPGATARGMER